MSEPENPSHYRLKQHFAKRVIHQARQVLEVWQHLQLDKWDSSGMVKLQEANANLLRYAERFEQNMHIQIAHEVNRCLEAVDNNRGRLSSSLITELNQLMQRLSRTGLRHGDLHEQTFLPPLRKPVYLALQNHEQAQNLVQQLKFFGISAQSLSNADTFRSAMAKRRPSAILMEIDFTGEDQGIALAAEVQQNLEKKLPLLFFSHNKVDTSTRLAAVRIGGQEFFTGPLDILRLIERIEILTSVVQYEPYKVLIVDDSLTQATHTERVLNNAGIVTRTLTKPILAMSELAEFQPDLIILDMYMPVCSGSDLAKVIRHNDRYVSMPIIYLSAEDDQDKQLDAMSEGGDDFLTKPIKPRHLVATVRNRASRARDLKAYMVRDSLTGLFNHTHTLQLLEDARSYACHNGQPLSFAMIDIDHFKKVNDTYGHPMGDRVIKNLALFLKQRLRKTDHIGRYGGEEFAVVLPDTDATTAAKVLDEIRKRFAEIHFPAHPQDLSCTFSCGITELHNNLDCSSLIQKADEALYSAKHGGRNRVAIWQNEITTPD